MKRRLTTRGKCLLMLGVALTVLSLLLPLAATAPSAGTGIIGGASAPTYWFLYGQLHLYLLTALGITLAALGLWKG